MNDILSRALAALQAGRAAEAEGLLRSWQATAGSVAALQVLGAALGAQGRHQEALDSFERAVALRAPAAALLHNRAQSLFHLGRFGEARAGLEQALALDAGLYPAWSLLAAALERLGEGARAGEAHDRAVALRPAVASSHCNRAAFLQRAGRIDEAARGFRAALQIDADFAPARAALIDVLEGAGLAAYRARRHEEAIARYAEALALDPARDEARNSMGGALAAAGRHDEAIECFRAVCARAPGNADAINNLGYVLHARGDLGAAAAEFRRALALVPTHADAMNNLGMVLQDQGLDAQAEGCYRRALDVEPGFAIAAYNLGILRLGARDFAEGWDLYERRYDTVPPVAIAQRVGLPRFGAQDWGAGQRIAVWGEQGIGDRLLYSTLLPELEGRGERFVLETDARLVAAYRRAHPDWQVVSREESPAAFAGCTRELPLASLPRLLRRTLGRFEGQPLAVIAADEARAAGYRARLEAPRRRIAGISWRSFQRAARGAVQRRKSAPLDAFRALARRTDLRLLDLQYGDTREERESFAAQGGELARLDELDLFHDIDGVISAIAACDVVVTTSNVTAHLAGGLGKPTLLVYLDARAPFHYWVADAAGRSLWYPSVRIVTAPGIDSWERLLERAGDLAAA